MKALSIPAMLLIILAAVSMFGCGSRTEAKANKNRETHITTTGQLIEPVNNNIKTNADHNLSRAIIKFDNGVKIDITHDYLKPYAPGDTVYMYGQNGHWLVDRNPNLHFYNGTASTVTELDYKKAVIVSFLLKPSN